MALVAADRTQLWSAQTTIELREKMLMYNLFDRSHEQEWQTAAQIHIAQPDWATNTTPTPDEGVTAHSRARGADWAGAQAADQNVVTLTRSGGFGSSNAIPWEEATEIPWPIVERHRSRMTYVMQHAFDTAIYTLTRASASGSTTVGTSGTTYVSRTRPYNATIAAGQDHPIMQAIDDWSLRAYRANAVDSAASPTGSASRPFMILQPELVKSLRQWLRDKGLSFDPLTQQLLTENVGMAGRGYVGTLSGVDIYSWNHLEIPTSGNEWEFYGGMREARTVAIRPVLTQFFTPAENQVSSNPSYLIRMASEYATAELVDGLHRQYECHEA